MLHCSSNRARSSSAASLIAGICAGAICAVETRKSTYCRCTRSFGTFGRRFVTLRRTSPGDRWAGAGVGTVDGPQSPAQDTGSIAVPLQSGMQVDQVIRLLFNSKAVCMDSGGEEVFYAKLTDQEETGRVDADSSSAIFCISLADLLEAPRSMPLKCLLDADSEECVVYSSAPDPYLKRSISAELESRLPWLVGLLAFLTVSSAILSYYNDLLERHLVIAFYLTALVGCGGNSGSQASALVLQALATREIVAVPETIAMVLSKELAISLGVAAVLSVGVALRIIVFGGQLTDALLIAVAMAITVVFSVVFGAAIPLVLQRLGFDPAKVSGPLLSTVIDIVGVLVACLAAKALESAGIAG